MTKVILDTHTGLFKTFPPPITSDGKDVEGRDYKNVDYNRWIYLSEKLLSYLPKSGKSEAKKFLDVGCGAGFLSYRAKKKGFNVTAIDTYLPAVKNAREKFKLKAVCTSLMEFNSEDKYNFIALNHVLEHVTDIENFLNKIKKLLNKKGYLLIASPNYDNLMRLIFKDRWYGLVPDQHVWQFTPETLRVYLEKRGFKITDKFPASLDYNPKNVFKKLVFICLTKIAEVLNKGDQLIFLVQKG